MPRLRTPALKGCWVDVYAGPTFGGAMHRLLGSPPGTPKGKFIPRLNKVGSVIVGPHAVAWVRLAGQPAGTEIALSPGTLVPDLSSICRTDLIIDLQVEALFQRTN